MSLKIVKEQEDFDLPFTATQRISKKILGELFGCEPDLLVEAAALEHVEIITGPKVSPDLDPVEQFRISDVPGIIKGLQKIAKTNHEDLPNELLSRVHDVDVSHDFTMQMPSGYTVIYQYEPKVLKPAA